MEKPFVFLYSVRVRANSKLLKRPEVAEHAGPLRFVFSYLQLSLKFQLFNFEYSRQIDKIIVIKRSLAS